MGAGWQGGWVGRWVAFPNVLVSYMFIPFVVVVVVASTK